MMRLDSRWARRARFSAVALAGFGLLATACTTNDPTTSLVAASATTETTTETTQAAAPDTSEAGGTVDPSATIPTESVETADVATAVPAAPTQTALPLPTEIEVEPAETGDVATGAYSMLEAFAGDESALGKFPELVYVPNTLSNTVHVIDPETYEIIDTFPTDAIPHHVTPSWDLTELYVLNTGGDSLLVMDPATGQPKNTIPVIDPYNLYFTPDGKNAIVVAERLRRLDIADPETFEVHTQVSIPWPGVDHMAFSRAGDYLVASTEFSGRIVKVSTVEWEVVGEPLAVGGEPIDVLRLPGTNTMLVANQGIDFGGIHVVDAEAWAVLDWIPTGLGTHGLMLTQDQERILVSNRGRATGTGSITVLDTDTLEVLDEWKLPGSASPDMGQLNPEGDEFWIAGRYDNEVYVIDTADGSLRARIPTDAGPHGLTYFPSSTSPHSLGHNGVYMVD